MRVSSITTAEFVDQFRHVLRQIAPKLHHFAGERVLEAQFGGVECLAGETESLEERAKLTGCAALGRVSQ